MPNPVSRVRPSAQFTRILAGLTSLCTRPRWCALPRAAAMPMARRSKASHLHRFADEALERFAARILEQQRGSTAFADKRERPRRPGGVEFVPQSIFVREAIEASRQRTLGDGQHGQHRVGTALAVRAPSSAEDAFAVLPQNLEISNPASAKLKGLVQIPDSAAPPRSRFARIPLGLCRQTRSGASLGAINGFASNTARTLTDNFARRAPPRLIKSGFAGSRCSQLICRHQTPELMAPRVATSGSAGNVN